MLAEAPCRCHSGRKYKRCCQPAHEGRPAASPEALMRARYCAYALGLAAYIQETTDPEGPQWEADTAAWAADIQAFSQNNRFVALKIVSRSLFGEEEGAEAFVAFEATLRQGGEDRVLAETSRFVRRGGRWRYHAGRSVQR